MISIIICSIHFERCVKMLKNISETIGVDYETIVFNNRKENWGICRVYNHCAEKAKYPFLCFVHEDLLFGTQNWGKTIIDFIEKTPNCGVVGFAGGFQAQKNFSSWWAGETRINVWDGYNGNNDVYLKTNYRNHQYSNPGGELSSQVLCIDGLFQFVRKSIWEEIKYDEMTFSGFHFYDVDFTLAISEKYNNYVLFDFDVFHDSEGHINTEYAKNMFIFQEKWNKKLPKNIINTAREGRIKNLRSELSEVLTIFNICTKWHIKLSEFFRQIYKINGSFFFVLALIYIPIKIILRMLKKLMKKYKTQNHVVPSIA